MSATKKPHANDAAVANAAARLAMIEGDEEFACEFESELATLNVARAKLQKAVRSARSAQSKVVHKKQSDKTGMPRGFSMHESGVFRDADPDREESLPIRICGVLRVVARTSDVEGNNPGRMVEWCDEDGRERRGVVANALLDDNGKAASEWLRKRGLSVGTDPRQKLLLAQYLNESVSEKCVQIVTKVGWHETDGGKAFVLADKAIGPEGGVDIMFQSERGDDAPPLKCAGGLAEWQHEVGRPAVGNSRLTLAISAALAAPLLGLLGVAGGGFHLRGASSTGKTTGLKVAGSIWGGHDWGVTWRTTDNGLESTAARFNDLLLCLDEISQAPSRTLGDTAYMLAQGEGKARAARNGGWRETVKWRVLFLSTGEESLGARMSEDRSGGGHLKEGQALRVLDVPADTGHHGMLETLHEFESGKALSDHLVAATRRLHGTLGTAWLELLVAEQGAIAKEVAAEMTRWQKEHVPQEASGQVHRAGERFALVAAAGAIVARRGLLPWPDGWAGRGTAACFKAWLGERQGGIGRGEDASAIVRVRRYLAAYGDSRFAELVTATQMKMLPEDAMVDGEGGWLEKGDRVAIQRSGFRRRAQDGTWEFIIMKDAFAEIIEGLDQVAAGKALREAGHLAGADHEHICPKVRLPGIGRLRCYIIRSSIFEG
jgi:putative DNA primase/helicase